MKRLMLLSAFALAGCYTDDTPAPQGIATFDVQVTGLYAASTSSTAPRAELPVVNECATRYGSQPQVPAEVRGTPECRYRIPTSAVDLDLEITAVDVKGQPLESFNGPVSFRVVPGNLTGAYSYRWKNLTNGRATATVRAAQLYGELHVWVQDEPPEVDYAEGEVVAPDDLPQEPATRTFATGLSRALHFEEPTVSTVQTPQGGQQLTAYNGTYMRIGRTPESGAVLRQNCPEGDPNDNQPVTLLVTGTDPGGFFVTDLTACRVKEDSVQGATTRTPEPDGYFPGRFNSLYIYNYSFPEGLDPGDLLWAVAGSVQEFTATTQLTFPSWSVREHVRLLPQQEWDKYLKLVPPVEINARLCGQGSSPQLADPLCGYDYSNFKMEGLESSLVKVRRVRFPQVFHGCDANGNGTVPFFCPSSGTYGACGADAPGDTDAPERQCNIDCTLGIGQFAGRICSEKNTFDSFGQFVVEMNPAGPPEVGLDGSVPGRIARITALVDGKPETLTWGTARGLPSGGKVHVLCDKAAFIRFGGLNLPTTPDVPLAAQTLLAQTLTDAQFSLWFRAQDEANGAVTCQVSPDSRTRFNVVTKDAVPDLVVNCREDDPDAARAEQCRFLHGATFDITGHLRQVSAARPRWMVLPRDQDDLCCYPGPDMQCPKPIKACANP